MGFLQCVSSSSNGQSPQGSDPLKGEAEVRIAQTVDPAGPQDSLHCLSRKESISDTRCGREVGSHSWRSTQGCHGNSGQFAARTGRRLSAKPLQVSNLCATLGRRGNVHIANEPNFAARGQGSDKPGGCNRGRAVRGSGVSGGFTACSGSVSKELTGERPAGRDQPELVENVGDCLPVQQPDAS
jgi:hypothetical protein